MIWWEPIALLPLAYVLLYVERRMLSPAGGFDTMDAVLKGVAHRPNQYRLLVPWLCWLLRLSPSGMSVHRLGDDAPHHHNRFLLVNPGRHYCGWLNSFDVWSILKGVALWLGLCSFYIYLGALGLNQWYGIVALALIMVPTFLYDYICCYWEMFFFGLFLSLMFGGGPLWGMAVIATVSALNRESTVVLLPVYFFTTYDFPGSVIVGGSLVVGLLIPRLIYGFGAKGPLPWVVTRYILKEMRDSYARGQEIIFNRFNLGFVSYICYFLLAFLSYGSIPGYFRPIVVVMAVFMICILLPGDIRETRMFLPVTFAAVPSWLWLTGG